jgi:sigma-B regulation protein RsbU (phosphoserine phosphatase)
LPTGSLPYTLNGGGHTMDPSILSGIPFSDFLDQVQDGLYIVDSAGTIVFWNRAAEELTGFPASTAIGRSCLDRELLGHRTVRGDDLGTPDACPLLRCMAGGAGGTVPHLIVGATASGRPLPLSLSVSPLAGPDGTIRGAVALFHGMRDEYQQRKLAIEIQKRTITSRGFARNGVRVETLFAPVDEIGGDFLEAFFLDDHTLIATLADATGHGISASLFTMAYKTLLHTSLAHHRAPGRILEHVNTSFLESAGIDGYYIGACVVSYDTARRHGTYASAGHPPGLVFQREGTVHGLREEIGTRSPMLGMNEAARFAEVEFELPADQLLLLVSDGITEAPSAGGKQFGVSGIDSFFRGYSGSSPLPDLLSDVRRRGSAAQVVDDMSAMLVAPV